MCYKTCVGVTLKLNYKTKLFFLAGLMTVLGVELFAGEITAPISGIENKKVTLVSESSSDANTEVTLKNAVLYYQNDVITVSYLNMDGSPLRFTIETGDGADIYNETEKKMGIFHSRLAPSKLPEGDYVAVLMVDTKRYESRFTIAR